MVNDKLKNEAGSHSDNFTDDLTFETNLTYRRNPVKNYVTFDLIRTQSSFLLRSISWYHFRRCATSFAPCLSFRFVLERAFEQLHP